MVSAHSAQHRKLSVIIPVFNEEENLPLTAEGIFSVLGTDPDFLELVLVDDGSQDRTVEIAKQLIKGEPRIRLVCHDKNRGLGAAIKTGLHSAEGDLVLYTDADLPFDFKLIPELLACSKSNNIVIGCRQNRGEGGRRWILTKGYNLITRLVLSVNVQDVNFACKLIPKRAIQAMKLQSDGSFIDAEILLECRRLGYGIVEYPMKYFPRQFGQSTLSRPRVVFGIVKELIQYLLRRASLPRYEIVEEIDPQRR